MAADRAGREAFSPAFTTHSGVFVHFENTAQPPAAAIPPRRGVSFRIGLSSRLRLLHAEESRGHRSSQRACRKISAGKALPLSSLESCMSLDQNIFLLDFHDSIWCHIVNRSDCLCRIGNQWVGKLFQAPLPTRALLISASKAQLIH